MDADGEYKDKAFREESVDLRVSMHKETLRFKKTTTFALPGTGVTGIKYWNTTIPKGTTMIMNAQQVNHDTAWYRDAAMVVQANEVPQ